MLFRSGSELEAAIRRKLQTFTPLASKTILLEDIPTAVQYPPGCLSRARSAEDCSFPNEKDSPNRVQLRDIADRVPGITVVNPYSKVCPSSQCQVVRDGIIMYFDEGHLTNTFAETLDGWVSQWLGSAVNSARAPSSR